MYFPWNTHDSRKIIFKEADFIVYPNMYNNENIVFTFTVHKVNF